jgi:tRNA pseudouridine38-40 synthase
VLSFRTESGLPCEVIGRALASRLPDDVVAGPSYDADPGFDARRSARWRHYRYTIWNKERANLWWRRYSLHVPDRLDESAMGQAAAALLGRHDFSSFVGHAAQQPRYSGAVRTVQRADWLREGDLLHFDCCADAFARHMVRNVVGTLLSVGRGRTRPAGGRTYRPCQRADPGEGRLRRG